jgi:hypothetical protein
MEWEMVAGEHVLDKSGKNISVNIDHFSVYSLVSIRALENSLNNVMVYPNPYKPNTSGPYGSSSLGEGIVFDGLTQNANISIFNIAGELVAKFYENDGDGRILWNARNNGGRKVASGVYIYIIENPDRKTDRLKGVLAVIK